MRLFILAVLTLSFVACGAESSNTYTPTTDTVSTTGVIAIGASSIRITMKGPTATSDIIEDCTIGFEKDEIAYEIVSQDELKLGGQTFELVRPLNARPGLTAPDERLLGVWKLPEYAVGPVTYSLEVEIRSDTIVYRNTCTR